jgi:menaquinone-dependent protoporphyrinogen oxidase
MPSPRVLVAYASKHGSTAEIAATAADGLRRAGCAVDLLPVAEVRSVDPYDAVVIGSAVYAMRWRPEALAFVERHRDALVERAVWLFSSGPLDHSAETEALDPIKHVRDVAGRVDARGHAWFGGALASDARGFVERLMVRAGAAGDYRDLEGVRSWAGGIGVALVAPGEPLAADPATVT